MQTWPLFVIRVEGAGGVRTRPDSDTNSRSQTSGSRCGLRDRSGEVVRASGKTHQNILRSGEFLQAWHGGRTVRGGCGESAGPACRRAAGLSQVQAAQPDSHGRLGEAVPTLPPLRGRFYSSDRNCSQSAIPTPCAVIDAAGRMEPHRKVTAGYRTLKIERREQAISPQIIAWRASFTREPTPFVEGGRRFRSPRFAANKSAGSGVTAVSEMAAGGGRVDPRKAGTRFRVGHGARATRLLRGTLVG